jgi:hypothetical protein
MSYPIKVDYSPAKTIDEVIDVLDSIVEETVALNTFGCAFAFVYLQTTKEVKMGLQAGRFENRDLLEELDVVFANLYINAYREFSIGNKTATAWEYAFQHCSDKLALIQHILLGMNAHINLDLAIAASLVAPGKKIMALKNDFMTVNHILGDLTNPMQRGLSKVSPLMGLLDIFGFRNDEKLINFSIRKARDFAWVHALELAQLNGDAWKSRISEIDQCVVEISERIGKPTSMMLRSTLWLISKFEFREPHRIVEAMKKSN